MPVSSLTKGVGVLIEGNMNQTVFKSHIKLESFSRLITNALAGYIIASPPHPSAALTVMNIPLAPDASLNQVTRISEDNVYIAYLLLKGFRSSNS